MSFGEPKVELVEPVEERGLVVLEDDSVYPVHLRPEDRHRLH